MRAIFKLFPVMELAKFVVRRTNGAFPFTARGGEPPARRRRILPFGGVEIQCPMSVRAKTRTAMAVFEERTYRFSSPLEAIDK